MKKFLLLLFLATTPLLAQKNELQGEAIRAFQSGDYATSKSLFESLLSIEPKNQAAQNYLRMIAQKEKGDGPGIESGLKKIIIPKVDFRDVSVREAVAFVSQRVRDLSGGKQAMNVVWLIPPDNTATVTLSLQNIPANEVLKYIVNSSNLRVDYDLHAIKIKPAGEPAGVAPAQ